MSMHLSLPSRSGGIENYRLSGLEPLPSQRQVKFRSRIAFAAAHVVADPLLTSDPVNDCALDWNATLAYRRHLWKLGFGVAEAMDTAQRGMGLRWTQAKELIRLTCAESTRSNNDVACGANTDNVSMDDLRNLDDVIRAYAEQAEWIERCGGQVIVMASRALAQLARNANDYRHVYRCLLQDRSKPVILHWLGNAFDPALEGYWGSSDMDEATNTVLELISECRSQIDGIKISLLDRHKEISMRRCLPDGVRMYTGDDFAYPELIEGDAEGYSDALLGIFDAIAPAAAAALERLDEDDHASYRNLLAPTLPLSRHIFQQPTYFYKTGIVFLAYLNGFQSHFHLVGGAESARSITHLADLFRLADHARLLRNPELAVNRFRPILAAAGITS